MNKQLWFGFMIIAVLVISAGLSYDDSVTIIEEPNLPAQPYDYTIYFPDHGIYGSYSTVKPDVANAQITDDGATLGRVLFYDKQLSSNNTISCASCHKQEYAFADDAQYSNGKIGQLTKRNSPNLTDLLWGSGSTFFENTFLFWDGRESVMEEMVLVPLQDDNELGKDLEFMEEKLSNIDYYPPLFEKAFGDSEVTKERVAIALSQFIKSITHFDSKYDLVKMGQASFTDREAAGDQIFTRDCKSCHGEHNFSSILPLNNGLDEVYTDLGQGGWDGKPENIGKFKSPSLRNIAVTAPYMHDGRFTNLTSVIQFYSEEVKPHPNSRFNGLRGENFRGFRYSTEEKKNLLAFLRTLTGKEVLTNPKWSDPFQPLSEVEQIDDNDQINVFPNPVENNLTIELKYEKVEESLVSISDLKGQVVWKNSMNQSSQNFEINHLNSGVYVLKIETAGSVFCKKLFIQ